MIFCSLIDVLTDPVEFYIEYMFDFQNYALQFLAVFRNLVHNLQREYHKIAFYQSTFAQEKKVTIINFHHHLKIKFPVNFTISLSERSELLMVEASHPSPGPQKPCSSFLQPLQPYNNTK